MGEVTATFDLFFIIISVLLSISLILIPFIMLGIKIDKTNKLFSELLKQQSFQKHVTRSVEIVDNFS